MARTTEEKAKRARDGAEDAVYKPVRGAKKPVRIESETPERRNKACRKKNCKKRNCPGGQACGAQNAAEIRTPSKRRYASAAAAEAGKRACRGNRQGQAARPQPRGRRKGDPDCAADRSI